MVCGTTPEGIGFGPSLNDGCRRRSPTGGVKGSALRMQRRAFLAYLDQKSNFGCWIVAPAVQHWQDSAVLESV